jgi:hypothetical protein
MFFARATRRNSLLKELAPVLSRSLRADFFLFAKRPFAEKDFLLIMRSSGLRRERMLEKRSQELEGEDGRRRPEPAAAIGRNRGIIISFFSAADS